MKTEKEIQVVTGDRLNTQREERLPVVIVLDRLRSAFNVGNLFRLAETTHIQEVICCGYTATPPHPKLEKTARGCDQLVPFRHFETGADAVRELKNEGYSVYAVETVEGAFTSWEAEIEFPAAFVLGNEALGISADALDLCDGFIALPCFGTKNSLNVGNCGAVVLYEVVRRLQNKG